MSGALMQAGAAPLTMSSREIATLVESDHNNVKVSMRTLRDKGLIGFHETHGNPGPQGGRPVVLYHVNQRDSYVVVAQLSPAFTAALVDRWQELEAQAAQPYKLPGNFREALLMLADEVQGDG